MTDLDGERSEHCLFSAVDMKQCSSCLGRLGSLEGMVNISAQHCSLESGTVTCRRSLMRSRQYKDGEQELQRMKTPLRWSQ